MKKVILLPEDRQRFETALGQALPNPSSPEFDEFLDGLQEDQPELAAEIRNSVKVLGIPSANEVQAVKAKETKKNAAFWQNLFYKKTPDGWVQDKGKITRTAIVGGIALISVLALGLLVRPAQSSGFSLKGMNSKPVNATTTNSATTGENDPLVVPAPDGSNTDPNNPNGTNPNNPNPSNTDPSNSNGTNPNNPNATSSDPNNPNATDPNAPSTEPYDASPTPRQTATVNNNGSSGTTSNGSSGTASSGYPNQSGSSQTSSGVASNSNPSGAANPGTGTASSSSQSGSSQPRSKNTNSLTSSTVKTTKHGFVLQNGTNPNGTQSTRANSLLLASSPVANQVTPNHVPSNALSVQNSPVNPRVTPNQVPSSALNIQNAPATPRATPTTPINSNALSIQNSAPTPRATASQTTSSALSIQNAPTTPRAVNNQPQAPSSALSIQNSPAPPRATLTTPVNSNALSIQNSAPAPRATPNQTASSALSIQNASTTPRAVTNPSQTPSSALSIQNSPATPRATPTQSRPNNTSGIALQSSSPTARPQAAAPQTSSGLSVQSAVTPRASNNQTQTPSSSLGIGSSDRPALAPKTNTMLVSGNNPNNNLIAGSSSGGIALGGGNFRLTQNSNQAQTPPSSVPLGFPSSQPQDVTSTAQTQSTPSGLPGSGDLPRLESIMQLSVGSRLPARLVISVVAVESGSAPIVAVTENPPCGKPTCPSIVWIGQALLGPDRRVWASFTQATVDGTLYSLAGQALEPTELRPGLPAQISDEAPSLISDLLRGAIGSFSDYLGGQLGAKSTSTSGGVTTQTQTVPSLADFFLGRLAGLFSIPSDTKALVRVARVPVDTSFTVLYGIPLNIGR